MGTGALRVHTTSWATATTVWNQPRRQMFNSYRMNPYTIMAWVFMSSTAVPDFTYPVIGGWQGSGGNSGPQLRMHHNNGSNIKRLNIITPFATTSKNRISANNTLVANAWNFVAGYDTNPKNTSSTQTQAIMKGDLTTAASATTYVNNQDGSGAQDYIPAEYRTFVIGSQPFTTQNWCGRVSMVCYLPFAATQAQIQKCQFDFNYALQLAKQRPGGLFFLPGADGGNVYRDLASGLDVYMTGTQGVDTNIWPRHAFKGDVMDVSNNSRIPLLSNKRISSMHFERHYEPVAVGTIA